VTSIQKTKNDLAWEALFEKYHILHEINNNGFFEIESRQINEFRESRLMAKFDHYINLPHIFKANNISILPISRTKYILGNFATYYKVDYIQSEPLPVSIPFHIHTIDYTDLYSESAALHFAYNSGLINEVIGEESLHTVSGRMSSNTFDFNINSVNGGKYSVAVQNSQIEIDGGFESQNCFAVVEAKNFSVDDILIRQLYYPYRLWSSKISKQVLPIFMTFSQDTFSFFKFRFEDPMLYNSLVLESQQDYIIAPEDITLDDIIDVFRRVIIQPAPIGVPFPQADSFPRVLDFIGLLFERDLTRDETTENYEFDIRQTNYYSDATRYLGFVDKKRENGEIIYYLTPETRMIMGRRYKAKYLSLVQKILERDVFYNVFEVTLNAGAIPDIPIIKQIMVDCGLIDHYNLNTIDRRSKTVRNWINWIIGLTT
jgi:hypothetical protein